MKKYFIALIILLVLGVIVLPIFTSIVANSDGLRTSNDMDDMGVRSVSSVSGTAVMGVIQVCTISVAGIMTYLIPTVVACHNVHPYKGGIILIDIFLGWTLLGWVGSLVWACILPNNNDRRYGNKYEDLETLQKLKEKGAITEAEFEFEKNKLFR